MFDLYQNTTNTWIWLVDWLCLMSPQQPGHLETTPPFTVPCKGREARFLTPLPPGIKPWVDRVAVHYTTAAPRQLCPCFWIIKVKSVSIITNCLIRR